MFVLRPHLDGPGYSAHARRLSRYDAISAAHVHSTVLIGHLSHPFATMLDTNSCSFLDYEQVFVVCTYPARAGSVPDRKLTPTSEASMAAIRTEEIAYATPPKLKLVREESSGQLRDRPWHPSMGSAPVAGESSFASQVDTSRTKRPNYKLRRLSVALVAIVTLSGLAWGATSTIAAVQTPVAGAAYVVRPGDTLWGIAQQHSPGTDPRRTVDAIRRINQIGPELVPGQQIYLPA